jgi:hypothetical protein
MPGITTGLSLRLPSFISSSAPHLCIQWSSSLRLTRKPDGFETPVLIPWQDKIAYKFIVDGRWMTNDREPTEIDHGFVNNVYTAPPKPPTIPLSYHPEPAVEPEHAEKVPVAADKPVANGSALDEPHEAATPTAEPAPELPSTEGVKAVITPAAEAVQHVAVAQVAPDPQEVERASEEVRSNPDLSELDKEIVDHMQLAPVPQAPKEPVAATVSSPVQSDTDQERSTHAPVRFVAGARTFVVVEAQVKEQVASASEPKSEGSRDMDPARVGGPAEEVLPTPVENGASASGAEPSKDTTVALGEEAKVAAGPEPAPEPEPEPAVHVIEPVPEPPKVEGSATAEVVPAAQPEEVAVVPEASKPVPSPAPAPAVDRDSAPAESTKPTPAAEPDTKPSEATKPAAPAVNGHTKSTSTASTSTAVPSLPTTASRKASRNFSFPGRDKSGNSSPTGSSRFSGQQKREKRHSILGKLKEIFGDKEKKKEKEKEKSAKA